MLVLLGALTVSTTAIYPLSLQWYAGGGYASLPVATAGCNAAFGLWSCGLGIASAVLIVRLHRVLIVFNNPRMRMVSFSTARSFGAIAALQVANVALLLALFLAAPLQYVRTPTVVDINGYVVACHGRCTSTSALSTALLAANVVYVLGLLGAALGMAFKARNIPSDFQESAYLFMATLMQLELYVVAIPVVLLVDSSQTQVVFLLLCSLIAVNNCSLASFLVVPKMVLAIAEGSSAKAKSGINMKAAPSNSEESAAGSSVITDPNATSSHPTPSTYSASQAPDNNASQGEVSVV